MSNTRDTAEHINTAPSGADVDAITEPVLSANAIGNYFADVFNANNSSTDRVAMLQMPGGKIPTGIITTGTFDIRNSQNGLVLKTATSVALSAHAANGLASIQVDYPFSFVAAENEYLAAASADASITFTYA